MNDTWETVLAVFSAVLAFFGISKIHAHKVKVDAVAESKNEINQRLYRQDGTTIYKPRDECGDDRINCNAQVFKEMSKICTKLDSMDKRFTNRLESMDNGRNAARKDIVDHLVGMDKRLSGLEGRFDQYTEDQRFNKAIKNG